MAQRIQKVLAAAGVASRRAVEQMVLEGRVRVNGKVVTTLPVLVDEASDKLEVDGELIGLKKRVRQERVYILMNKPKGVYCTNVAQGVQKRAIDLLPEKFPYRVYPVGRLDADSKGLLLLTNDGELTEQLTHPSHGVAKTYRATVEGRVNPEQLEQLQKGIWLADKKGLGFKTGHSRLQVIARGRDLSILELTLREGRNRQVRRMLADVGHKVKELVRIKMGPLILRGLAPGEYRPLSDAEIAQLKRAARDASAASGARAARANSAAPPAPAAASHASSGPSRQPASPSRESSVRSPQSGPANRESSARSPQPGPANHESARPSRHPAAANRNASPRSPQPDPANRESSRPSRQLAAASRNSSTRSPQPGPANRESARPSRQLAAANRNASPRSPKPGSTGYQSAKQPRRPAAANRGSAKPSPRQPSAKRHAPSPYHAKGKHR